MGKKTLFYLITVVLSFGLLLIAAEIAVRVYCSSDIPASITDPKLGWRSSANYAFHGYEKDASGQTYRVDIETDKHGFRTFGDLHPEPGKKKILFVGDSFTHAHQVSNGKAYYDILGRDLSVEIFAYGGFGYGTLQRYMIIDEHVDVIKPDILVIQLCGNDISDDYFELDVRNLCSVKSTRPYLEKEEIVYRFPSRLEFLYKHSSLFKVVMYRIRKLRIKIVHFVRRTIEKKEDRSVRFERGSAVTEKVIKKIKDRVPPDIAIYAFSADCRRRSYETLKEISERNGIKFIDGVPQAVREAKGSDLVVKSWDKFHWNELGHEIVAKKLEEYFRKEWEI